jgi:pimeloyl-ACP methyl ester carboxylesterase
MNSWRVLYASEAIDGTPIEVSGIVSAPIEPPSEGLRGVVSHAHGTAGLFDACAPSLAPTTAFLTLATPLLVNSGYVAVATDYEGLGTPGDHPYMVGESEGRGVLDIVRAAGQIDEAHAGNRAVVWGVSQGGHAALFAGEIAPDWAPEIELLGVIPAAPGSELDLFFEERADTTGVRGFMWMLTVAYETTYPGLNLEDVYDAETLATIAGLVDQEACEAPFLNAARDVDNAGFVTNPADLASWRERLVENSPGYERSEMPILILQGSDDTIVPQQITDILFDRLCAIGSQTDYRVFEGLGHREAFLQNILTMLEWTNARFGGEAASDTCPD